MKVPTEAVAAVVAVAAAAAAAETLVVVFSLPFYNNSLMMQRYVKNVHWLSVLSIDHHHLEPRQIRPTMAMATTLTMMTNEKEMENENGVEKLQHHRRQCRLQQ